MMPKTTLIAPAGVGGQIHASGSGRNYDIGPDGKVVVDAIDVAPLLGAGYQHVPPTADHRKRDPEAPPVTSDAFGSQDQGASALNPADRMANTREIPTDTGQENHEHGDATPPHGEPQEERSTSATRADAQAEAEAAERSGADAEHSSAVANTGHMGVAHANEADQAEARGSEKQQPQPSDVHDAAYAETFKDAEEAKLRGKTKAEVDAGKSA